MIWIKREDVNPAQALPEDQTILIFTPSDDDALRFRSIRVSAFKTSHATHWAFITTPKIEQEKKNEKKNKIHYNLASYCILNSGVCHYDGSR